MRHCIAPERLPLVLRTSLGLAAVQIGASLCGAAVVGGIVLLLGSAHGLGEKLWIVGGYAGGYVLLAGLIGSAWTLLLQGRTVAWLISGRVPTIEEARRALRLPVDLAVVTAAMWAIGALLLGGIYTTLMADWEALATALAIILGGLTTSGVTYLVSERLAGPVMALALEIAPASGAQSVSVLSRMVLTWVVASGVPLLGVLLVVVLPEAGSGGPRYSLMVLAGAGLILGAVAVSALARTVATPLREMRAALDKITHGRTDIEVTVDGISEMGLLQTSVNDLARGLREQDRMRDLFGRHVGADVAELTLESGAPLTGDVREVTALFVDIAGSTELAYRLPPEEFVQTLNRFFTCVVNAVDDAGGLVNKFAGDAVLCVFGAPTPLPDAETAALRAARQIRDSVRAGGELDLGIGIACGPAFAGRLGTARRLEYSVIGDVVNEAARLTEEAKRVPGRILASESAIAAADEQERAHWIAHRRIRLRGRKDPTATWTAEATTVSA